MSDRKFDIDTFSLLSVDEFMEYVSVAFKQWINDNAKNLVDFDSDTFGDCNDAECVFSSFLFMYPWIFDLFSRFLSDDCSGDSGHTMIHKEIFRDRMVSKDE